MRTEDPLQAGESDGSGQPAPPNQPPVEALREILLRQHRERIAELEAELDGLEQVVTDKDRLVTTISPVLGDAIRRQIRDSREEMIEALYPIIGDLVVRAVAEAVRDLARTVDAQVRRSFDIRGAWWRLRARLGGASQAEMSLRAALPFSVSEVFLIHRNTGLLLQHVSRVPASSRDSDLVGSMLTAISDFAQDAFGAGKDGQLEEIEYGDQRILIEPSRHAALAVVVDGTEPTGFRAEMRERVIEIEHDRARMLREFDGDTTPFTSVEPSLRTLLAGGELRRLTRSQRLLVAGALSLLVACCAVAAVGGSWAVRRMVTTPTSVAVISQPTASATATELPTNTPIPTWTSSPEPTLTPTATCTPLPAATVTATATNVPTLTPTPEPAPVLGLMTGNAWLRQAPEANAARLGAIARTGEQVEILAVYGDWCHIRLSPSAQAEATGWVPRRWVGTLEPISAHIITPTAAP